jgi:hypothetical protein
VLGKQRLTKATQATPARARATPPTRTDAGTRRATTIAIARTATYSATWSNCANARSESAAQRIEIRIQTAKAPNRPTATTANRWMPARADATPEAAPTPNNHHAAIPAYARVVEAKPPFAYERAKTVAAAATPTREPRTSALCSPFTFGDTTGGYSKHRVRWAEPAQRGCPGSRGSSRSADHGPRLWL